MKKYFSILYILCVFSGCSLYKYGTYSSKEEAGMQFTQISSDGENIVGPAVVNNATQFRWYPGKIFAIDYNYARLAFLGVADNSHNIFVKDLNKSQISMQRTFRGDVNGLSFSADGSEIVYSDYSSGNSNIYTVPSNKGMRIRQITQSSEEEFDPTIGDSDNRIYFTKDIVRASKAFTMLGTNYLEFLNSSFIWMYDKEEKVFSQLTNGFSPYVIDDNTLLVTRLNSESKLGEIWMVDLKEEEEFMIMSNKHISFSTPSVSPDKKTIVCVGGHKSKIQGAKNRDIAVNNLNLFSFKLDGTDFRQLTYHPSNDACPVWGKDGKTIYFLSQRGNSKGDWNIWKMDYED